MKNYLLKKEKLKDKNKSFLSIYFLGQHPNY